MNKRWSLDIFYKSYEDESFKADFIKLADMAEGVDESFKKFRKMDDVNGLKAAIGFMEELLLLSNKLGGYIYLNNAADTADKTTNDMLAKFGKIMADANAAEVMLIKYAASIENLEGVIEGDKALKENAYYIRRLKEKAQHMMSEELEELAAKMNLNAGNAWSRLFDTLTASVEIDYKGEKVNLSQIRNMANDPDASVRKAAYEAELAGYRKIEIPIAFALNNIKGQVNMLSKKRGYSSPLEMTLKQCGMKKETLDAMLTAMNEYFPKFWEYLKAKSAYLGNSSSLPWYDLFAPVGKIEKKYTVEEAKQMLTESFAQFSMELSDMIRRAFDESWIDFEPRNGKVGGAFCSNAECAKQSRILTNFNGSFDSVVTLAHELGHAFHNQQIYELGILNQDYSMPVAETASTFNETHFMLNAYKNAQDKDEKLAILENLLMGTTQIICDIYSRYLFEDAVFNDCRDEFLQPEDLKRIMLDAQKKAYGDGLDPQLLHPYMWTCKSHYYSESLSYYNFPYAFGGLFAMGLYSIYQKEGESFVPEYKALLKATGSNDAEEVAQLAGIDITKADFWRNSLKAFAALIDEYVSLTK